MHSIAQNAIFAIYLFVHTHAVYSASCPAPCYCNFSDTLLDNVATCDWENSSISLQMMMANNNLKELDYFPYSIYSKLPQFSVVINCQGKTHKCEDLPQFDVVESSVSLYITSCTTGILRCFKHMYPRVTQTENVVLNHTKGNDYPNTFEGLRASFAAYDSRHTNSFSDDIIFDGANLLSLVIINNDFEHITATPFKNLGALSAIYLIKNKKLKSMDPKSLSRMENLKQLKLQSNALEYLSNEFLHGLSRISKVIIENNLVELRLDSQVFANTSLTYLLVTNSKLVILPEYSFLRSNALVHIDLGHNLIKHLPPKLFWYAKSIRTIILKNNRIQILHGGMFQGLEYLQNVDFSNNHIIDVDGEIFDLISVLINVVLDFNNITILNLDMFGRTSSLSLASNQINTITEASFRRNSVEYLNLSDNDISVFEYWHIYEAVLKKLNLSRNIINNIKESDLNMYDGVEIDFRYNNISNIIEDMNLKQSSSKTVLYLSNNPLQCNCSVTKILKKWKNNELLRDPEEIIFADGQHLSNVKLYTLCDTNDALITIIGSCAVGALVIAVIIISLIRRRNEIWQYITNICNQNNESNITFHQIRLDELKTHDVFISFAHQDSEFVADVLLPKLENDFGQKVCVHYRDWIVGELIPDQIIKSVESSRMTIIILTEHFLESDWSYLEFRTAHNLGIQEGRFAVIIIVMDEAIIGRQQLTPELKSDILCDRYLLWSDINFWEKLQQKLPRQGRKGKKGRNRS